MELSFVLNVTVETEVDFVLDQPMVDKIKELIKSGTIKCDEDIYNYLDLSEEHETEYGPFEEICCEEFLYPGDEYFDQLSS